MSVSTEETTVPAEEATAVCLAAVCLSARWAVAVISNVVISAGNVGRRRWVQMGRGAIGLAAASVWLAACVASRLPISPIPATADPQSEIAKLSAEIDHARAESLDVVSPGWFSKAVASLVTARSLRERNGQAADVLAAVADGHAELDAGFDVADVTAEILQAAIAARSAARSAGATAYEDDYAQAEKGFSGLAHAVEAGEIDKAKNRQGDVVIAFRALELKAIKGTTLRRVHEVMARARAEGASRYAPAFLAATESKIVAVEDFIASQPYARREMSTRADEALFEARRLAALTERASEIAANGPEKSAGEEDRLLAGLAVDLKLLELRDRSFKERRASIADAVRSLQADRNYLVDQSRRLRAEIAQAKVDRARLEGRSAEERGRLQKLEAERRFRRLYDEVSGYFQANEAQVYKQADRLVIRLHGLRFPVGTADLTTDSYKLLATVQKSIRAFGEPNVIVEGHTDDTGPPALNEHLSQERAGAVRDYLLSNNVLPAERVDAVGKGFSEPVASNKTAAGRALNRRIDVIIEPLVAPLAAPPAPANPAATPASPAAAVPARAEPHS